MLIARGGTGSGFQDAKIDGNKGSGTNEACKLLNYPATRNDKARFRGLSGYLSRQGENAQHPSIPHSDLSAHKVFPERSRRDSIPTLTLPLKGREMITQPQATGYL